MFFVSTVSGELRIGFSINFQEGLGITVALNNC